ncbi:MAG: abortive phage infection protein, partial [Leptolyngbyaceae cyanobacterium SL_7_1]|nr:abortive phage infection protein [Leptolyngbyaceae cyanobacterium SL_7_1]
NPSVTGLDLWKLVQVLRIVEGSLTEFQKLDGRERLLAVHGNRFLAHLVFQVLKSDLEDQDTHFPDNFKAKVIDTTYLVYQQILEVISAQFPNSYLASLFKNQSKCEDIKSCIKL